MIPVFRLSVVLACVFALSPSPAAAETSAICTGFIETLPATISTQGVWCLKKDLATSMSTGTAIDIAANNVTIDCNGYKVGGLAAGTAATTIGIDAIRRDNTTVHNCNVRGFRIGIRAWDTTGTVVIDNRLDGNTHIGIHVRSDGGVVRGNTVVDTGGNAAELNALAIETKGGVDIIDNLIDGVFPTGDSINKTFGILSWSNQGGVIARNRIRNVIANNEAKGIALAFDAIGVSIHDNVIYLPGQNAIGISCSNGSDAVVVRNILTGPYAGLNGCPDGGNTL